MLATHVGSLPRPPRPARTLLDAGRGRGGRRGGAAAPESARRSGTTCVGRVPAGIDVVDDGEMSKPEIHRLRERAPRGLRAEPDAPARSTWARSREARIPGVLRVGRAAGPARRRRALACTGPIAYNGHALVAADIANLKALDGASAAEVFVPAISPSNVGALAAERVLRDAGGVSLRHRRGDARGVPGHRRRRLAAPDRRPAPG